MSLHWAQVNLLVSNSCVKVVNFKNLEFKKFKILKLEDLSINNFKFKWSIVSR